MTAFLLLAGGLTCGFFLYVLVQFHRELHRREAHTPLDGRPRTRHSPGLQFRSLRRGSKRSPLHSSGNWRRVPLAETSIHVMVPRDT